MLKSILLGVIIATILILAACSKKNSSAISAHPHLIFKFVFDSTQVRLNDSGNVVSVPAGHAAQNPQMNIMSAHYIELAPTAYTTLGAGQVLYQTPNSTTGGSSAIDFSRELQTPNNGTFFSVALDSITPGTYQYLRVSLAYQNYNVKLYYDTTFTYTYSGIQIPITIDTTIPATIASFVGFNTYINSYTVNTENINVNGNRAQGYWGFEAKGTFNITYLGNSFPYQYNFLDSGQSPAGATTVVNPLFASSPIPAGSCVATGQFVYSSSAQNTSLTITGHETSDIVVTVSLSVNHSFEWVDVIPDGRWQPTKGEKIVDMGIRGLIPYISH